MSAGGLLNPDSRTRSNYRAYTERAADRLKFIKAAQATGFSLKDIREMLALTFADEAPCAEVAALIGRRLEEVKERLRELRRVERALAVAHQSCCKGGKDWCREIVQLKVEKVRDSAPPRPGAARHLTLY